jgi:hypothetical protein
MSDFYDRGDDLGPTGVDATDVFNVDTNDVGDQGVAKSTEPAPVYRIYEGSRIAISSSVGKLWEKKVTAAIAAYEQVVIIWDEVFKYYNNNQNKSIESTRGLFKRGDGTENIMFSNLNIMLPAVYSKNPDVTCSTIDEVEEPFTKSLEKVLNTLIRGQNGLNAKPKIKKAVGVGLLTNFGVLKLDWTKKNDSREIAVQQMQSLTDELASAKTQEQVELIYGKLEALELSMEVLKPSGPSLCNVLPHNLIIDPYAEQQDGSDADWMAERCFLSTAMLTERYTIPDPATRNDSNSNNLVGNDGGIKETSAGARTLVYKPTHKAAFNTADGRRDDGLGLVLQAIESGSQSTHHTDDERTAYLNMYTTECYIVWDKVARRVMLFQRDDWSWPLWVWDDPLVISRFFPYFIIGYTMSTGGTVAVGETAYYMDQQDAINDINRKMKRMRTSVFDYFLYNSDMVDSDQIEKLINAVRGEGSGDAKHVIGVKAGEKKVSDLIEPIVPRMDQYKELFDKQSLLDAINRITNTSDALRGVQFKTNTNEDAVNTYQESMKLSVGAKVDVVEDVVAAIAHSLAELSVQNLTQDDVVNLVGPTFALAWRQMSMVEFNGRYSVEIVAGSMEKPNSVFKKKEAVQIAQAVGQFAQAAPGATLQIMLRVLEQAFTEVVIKPEDWQAITQEMQAKTAQGVGAPQGTAQGPQSAQGGAPAQPGAQGGQPQQGAQGQNPIAQILANLPPEIKQQVVAMKQQGKTDQQIQSFLLQHVAALHSGQTQPQGAGAGAPKLGVPPKPMAPPGPSGMPGASPGGQSVPNLQ